MVNPITGRSASETPAPPISSIRSPYRRRYQSERNLTPWIVGAIVLLGLAVGGYVYQDELFNTPGTAPSASTLIQNPGRNYEILPPNDQWHVDQRRRDGENLDVALHRPSYDGWILVRSAESLSMVPTLALPRYS